MDTLALRLALGVEFFLVADAFERSERRDSGHLKDRERDLRIILCTVDRTYDLVLCAVEIFFGRFSLDRVIENGPDVRLC